MRTSTLILIAALSIQPLIAQDDNSKQTWRFIGHTRPVATIEMQARVTGYVTEVAVKEGDTVAQGDLLIKINPHLYKLALDVAKAQMKMAEADLTTAKLKAANTKAMRDKELVSQLQVDKAMAIQAKAQAALDAAKAQTRQARMTLDWTQVNAPFAGRVSNLHLAKGSLVLANQTPILTLSATDPMGVAFGVPETAVWQLRRDGRLIKPEKLAVKIDFRGDGHAPYDAKVVRIASVVNSATGNVQFFTTLPNPKGLYLPGMTATVSLTAPQ